MKNNKPLLYFVLGGIFVIFIPLIENISDLLNSWIEVFKINPIKRTLKGNNEINDLQVASEKYDDPIRMGFQIDDAPEYYDEDDCDDKASNKCKNKVGF